IVGLTYRVLTELVDGVAGLLGGLLVLALQHFRFVSIMMLGQPVMMLWSLLGIWAWLVWQRQKKNGWLLAIGIVFGWAGITRPVDALCVAVPVGAGIVWSLRGRPMTRCLTPFALILAGGVPFLTIQLIANKGITGHWLETPYRAYLARDYPGITLGFAPFGPEWKPTSNLLQKRVYYEDYIVPELKNHTVGSILPNLYRYRL